MGCIVPSCEEKVGAAYIPTEVETRKRRVSLCAELSMGALMVYQWAFVAAAVDCHARLMLGPCSRKVSGRSIVNP